MTIRQLREELEERVLSPYAAKSSKSRRSSYEEPCPIRTSFQRDRDRILYSKAFRRLMHKTQVFIAPEGDHYRTRLTHTIEVSQIARTISRALNLNEDLTEAIALGHDLGHAPFGHAGEDALNEMMKDWGGFHHAKQSLRVVEYLERDGGLNLTEEVKNGILAHTKGKGGIDDPKGFAEPKTLEAWVVRYADRIAYINHDIDDAIRAGIIKLEDIPKDLRELFGNTLSERIRTMVLDIVNSSRERLDKGKIFMSPHILKGLESLKDFMFARVYTNSPAKKEEGKVKVLIRHLFEFYMEYPEHIPLYIIRRGVNKHSIKDLKESEKAKAVCDYMAGMTDRFAIAQFKKYFIPKGWSL